VQSGYVAKGFVQKRGWELKVWRRRRRNSFLIGKCLCLYVCVCMGVVYVCVWVWWFVCIWVEGCGGGIRS